MKKYYGITYATDSSTQIAEMFELDGETIHALHVTTFDNYNKAFEYLGKVSVAYPNCTIISCNDKTAYNKAIYNIVKGVPLYIPGVSVFTSDRTNVQENSSKEQEEIREIAELLCRVDDEYFRVATSCDDCEHAGNCSYERYAQELYKEGYRKREA